MSLADFSEAQSVVQMLQRSLDRGRLSHAYLFSGSDLSALEGMAGALAKTLTCLQPPKRSATGTALDCCDRCLNCRKIEAKNHADVQWLRPESRSRIITIDQIRDLMQTVYLKPMDANCKVAMIVAADRLNVQAANAFLKTLEEPPANCTFLLLSTNPQHVLETIYSRCSRLVFHGEEASKMNNLHFPWVLQFSELATNAQKGLLGRYRILSVISKKLNQIKEAVENTLTSSSPLARNQDAEPRLREKWEDELTASIEAEYRRQRGEVLLALEWWMRDIWLWKSGVQEESLTFPDLREKVMTIADRISPREARENIELLESVHSLLGSNVQEALALELSVLRLAL